MKALIAAGGKATRLRPISYTLNKHLIPLANEPMIWNAIKKISDAGITDIIINVNPGESDVMRAVVGDGGRWGARITFVEQQGGARGIAHAVANAERHLGNEPFVFFLGDNILLGSIESMKRRFEADGLNCLIALSRVDDPTRFGVAEFDANGELTRAVEKPENPPSPLAITGIYFFDENYFKAFKTISPSARGEFEITDIISWYIANGKTGYEEITGWWKDTGKPADLLEGNALLLEERMREQKTDGAELLEGVDIQGNVEIGAGSVIGPNVQIRGPSIIGENCRIECSTVGPHTSIGKGSEIRNTEIEHSIVFENARIDCGARIVDSIIGTNTVINSAARNDPRAHRLIIGDHGVVEL